METKVFNINFNLSLDEMIDLGESTCQLSHSTFRWLLRGVSNKETIRMETKLYPAMEEIERNVDEKGLRSYKYRPRSTREIVERMVEEEFRPARFEELCAYGMLVPKIERKGGWTDGVYASAQHIIALGSMVVMNDYNSLDRRVFIQFLDWEGTIDSDEIYFSYDERIEKGWGDTFWHNYVFLGVRELPKS